MQVTPQEVVQKEKEFPEQTQQPQQLQQQQESSIVESKHDFQRQDQQEQSQQTHQSQPELTTKVVDAPKQEKQTPKIEDDIPLEKKITEGVNRKLTEEIEKRRKSVANLSKELNEQQQQQLQQQQINEEENKQFQQQQINEEEKEEENKQLQQQQFNHNNTQHDKSQQIEEEKEIRNEEIQIEDFTLMSTQTKLTTIENVLQTFQNTQNNVDQFLPVKDPQINLQQNQNDPTAQQQQLQLPNDNNKEEMIQPQLQQINEEEKEENKQLQQQLLPSSETLIPDTNQANENFTTSTNDKTTQLQMQDSLKLSIMEKGKSITSQYLQRELSKQKLSTPIKQQIHKIGNQTFQRNLIHYENPRLSTPIKTNISKRANEIRKKQQQQQQLKNKDQPNSTTSSIKTHFPITSPLFPNTFTQSQTPQKLTSQHPSTQSSPTNKPNNLVSEQLEQPLPIALQQTNLQIENDQHQTPKQQTPNQQIPNQQTPNQQTPKRQTPNQQTPNQQTPKQIVANQNFKGDENEPNSNVKDYNVKYEVLENGWCRYISDSDLIVYKISIHFAKKIREYEHIVDHSYFTEPQSRQFDQPFQLKVWYNNYNNGSIKSSCDQQSQILALPIPEASLNLLNENDHRASYSKGVLSFVFYPKKQKKTMREKTVVHLK